MEKKSKKGVIVGVTTLLLVTLLLLGLTYAYYRTRVRGNNSNTSINVQSVDRTITYTDGTASIQTGAMVEPETTFTKDFSISTTDALTYYIVLEDIESTFLRMQDWEWKLDYVDDQGNAWTYASGTLTTGGEQVLHKQDNFMAATANWRLTVTYKNSTEDQSIDMDASLSFKVNVSDEHNIGENTWASPAEGSLLASIKTANPSLPSTEDEYGTSYYFKGATVDNNFVNYSGMCWRIVRVQGNGTIKLILQDENNECSDTNFDVNSERSMYAQNSTKVIYSSDNDILFKNSEIPAFLETWSKRSEKELDRSLLVRDSWCNDTSIVDSSCRDDMWNEVSCGSPEQYSKHNQLAAFDRLESGNFSLKCNNEGVNYSKSTRYQNEIGILTMDEIYLSAENYTVGTSNIYSNNTFLIPEDANEYDDFYPGYDWTMTPLSLAEMSLGDKVGQFSTAIGNTAHMATSPGLVRPAIVVKSDALLDTTVSGQNGTYTNPYVIG